MIIGSLIGGSTHPAIERSWPTIERWLLSDPEQLSQRLATLTGLLVLVTVVPLFAVALRAVLNADMIGRTRGPSDTGHAFAESSARDTVFLLSGGRWAALDSLIARVNASTVGLALGRRYGPETLLFRRSDHYQFHMRNVPTVWIRSGIHPEYHQPSDDIDVLDLNKIAKVAQLMLASGRALLNDRGSR